MALITGSAGLAPGDLVTSCGPWEHLRIEAYRDWGGGDPLILSAADTWSWVALCWGLFCSLDDQRLRLYPLDVSGPSSIVTTRNASRIASCCLGGKIAPGDFKSTMANYHAVTQNKLFNHIGPDHSLQKRR